MCVTGTAWCERVRIGMEEKPTAAKGERHGAGGDQIVPKGCGRERAGANGGAGWCERGAKGCERDA